MTGDRKTDDRMRPIEELPAHVARSFEGIVFDLDDTLTRDGIVEGEAFTALFALRDAGMSRIAVTGRPLGWAEIIATLMPIDLAVGENGAGWRWRRGREVLRGHFEEDSLARERAKERLDAVRALVRERMPEIELAADQEFRACDLAFDVGETARVPSERIAELVGIIEGAGMRTMVSTVHAHAIPGEWDKARGTVRAVSQVLQVDEERLRTRFLFVGDSGNDAAAFAFFEHTAGVANVGAHLASLPVAPRWVASHDRGLGFAEIARAILSKKSDTWE